MKTRYLYPTKNGYTKVTRRIGRRKPKTGFTERMVAPVLLILTMTISGTMYVAKPLLTVQMVQAEEVSPVTSSPVEEQGVANNAELDSPKPTTTPSPKQEILSYIVEKFGDDAAEAIKIAECESQFNPTRVGDTHLMSYDSKNDEKIGDSIGIFQVRTGGAGWNRAKANGMTAEQFRTKLKDPRYNIDYAKTIFDESNGWNPWFNCKNKVL